MKSKAESEELREIRQALEEIRADLKKALVAPYDGPERPSSSNERALNVLVNQLMEDVDSGLEKGMVPKCGMRETCKTVFTDLLQRSASLVGSDRVSEDMVTAQRAELERRRAAASKSQCAKCFGEVSSLFDKHIRIARSMRIYRTEEEVRGVVERMPEDPVIKDILEPVSSKQRLHILKMLSSQSRSFSYLSERSGLRGGNLLFHLQRLVDSGMIIQNHERGDYLLTEKGYIVLKGVAEIMLALNGAEEEPAPAQDGKALPSGSKAGPSPA